MADRANGILLDTSAVIAHLRARIDVLALTRLILGPGKLHEVKTPGGGLTRIEPLLNSRPLPTRPRCELT